MFNTKDLHLFAEAIPHIVWASSYSGKIEYCNKYGLKYIGTKSEDLIGKSWFDYIHPEERPKVIEKWNDSILNYSDFHDKLRVLNSDTGYYNWFQVDICPLTNDNTEATKWIGVLINIEKEISETNELINNKVKLEEILNNLPDTNVYVFDENFRYIEVRGPKFEEGPLPKDIIGKTVKEAYGEEWAAFSEPLYQKVLTGGTFYEEVSTATKHYFVQGAPLNLPGDTTPKGILIVREITVQKNTVASLKKTEKDLRFLLEVSSNLPKFNTIQEIYSYLAEQLRIISGEQSSIVINNIVDDEKYWEIAVYQSSNKTIQSVVNLLGKNLTQLKGKITQNQKKKLSEKKLFDSGVNFTNLTGGSLNERVSNSLQRLLGIQHCYNMGVFHEKTLFGIITILVPQPLLQHKIELIETFVLLTSNAIEKVANKEGFLESENRYKSLVSTMREGVMSLDAEGVIITANKAVEDILGFTVDEILGKNILKLDIDIIVDELTFRKPKTHPISQVLQKKKSQRGIIIGIRKPQDRVIWISMNAEPIFKEDGIKDIDSIVVSFTDITKLKRSEARLALYLRQQTILTKVAQKLNGAYKLENIIGEVLTLLGNYTALSRVCIFENVIDESICRMAYKWESEDIKSDKNEELILDYEAIYPWKEILLDERIIATKSIETIEGTILSILKARQVKSIVALPLFIAEGFLGFISFEDCIHNKPWRKSELDFLKLVAEMISNAFERKKLQQDLIQSEERLLQANQLAKLGHWEWIPDEDEVMWSKEIFDFFNFDEKKGAPAFADQVDLYNAESTKLLKEAVNRTLETGESYELELRSNPEKYGTRYYHVMGIPEQKDGKLYRLFGSMQDITERKLVALQIEKQNHSLKKLNNELDLIMKVLSHDLKSPIHQAKGLIRLLEIEPTNKDVMSHMNKSIHKLQNITDDLLDLAINNRSEVEPVKIIWSDFIDKCVEEQEGNKGFSDIDWQITIEGNAIFISDTKRLKVILRNLFSNAIKYRNTSGEEKSYISVKVTSVEKETTIEVSDNGMGIAKEKLELIFEMFYQVDEAKSGVGLGLHIVRQMLEKIRGKVAVSSIENKGTSFRVTIPSLVN